MSFQNLSQEIKAVVLEKNALEVRDMSEFKAHFALLAYQDSDSQDEKFSFLDIYKGRVLVRYTAIETPSLKNEKRLN